MTGRLLSLYYYIMKDSFANYVLGTALLLLFPTILIVSWINVYLGQGNFELGNYFLAFLFPAELVSVALGVISYFFVAKRVHYTYGKIFFTLMGLVTILIFIRLAIESYGLRPIFITLPIHPQEAKAYFTANEYYSFSLPLAITATFILYQLSSLILEKKK